MNEVKMSNKVPDASLISSDSDYSGYCDSFQVRKTTFDSIDKIAMAIFSFPDPTWVTFLLKMRNAIVKPFGLSSGAAGAKVGAGASAPLDYYPIGSKMGMFTMIDRSDNEVVFGENDKHLNFKVSVLKTGQGENASIHVTTIVKFNNIWGRIYFTPVKPFHKLIVKSLVKNVSKW